MFLIQEEEEITEVRRTRQKSIKPLVGRKAHLVAKQKIQAAITDISNGQLNENNEKKMGEFILCIVINHYLAAFKTSICQ